MYANPISGIYKITNKENGKFYIGSSFDIHGRWAGHRSLLNRGLHSCIYLQNSWTKYGSDSFEFSILEEADKDRLLEREQYWLNETKCFEPSIGFNVLQKAGSNTGFKHSDETKAKISEKLIGKPKIRIKPKKIKIRKVRGEKLIGKKLSEEHKLKISEANKGRKLSDAHKANLRKPKNKNGN